MSKQSRMKRKLKWVGEMLLTGCVIWGAITLSTLFDPPRYLLVLGYVVTASIVVWLLIGWYREQVKPNFGHCEKMQPQLEWQHHRHLPRMWITH